jgi:L-xylulokinase
VGKYLMGIDNGLTVSKAAIFDLAGREVAVQGHKVELSYPKPAWVERDSEAVWRTTADAICGAITKAGIDAHDIVGVGNCAHGNGIYLLDKTGAPLGPSVTSMDNRASDIIEEWYRRPVSADGVAGPSVHDQNFPIVMTNTFAAQPAALLAWFKRHRPEVWRQIGHAFTCKDYIKFRLTGAPTADYSDMSGTSLYDSRNRRFSPELLELYGIADILPALAAPIESHAVAGRVTREAAAMTGLVEGTPVVGGMFDIDASAVGAGVIDEGMLCVIAGTWSINEVVTREPLLDDRLFMCNLFTVPGLWLVSDCSATSATNLEWFVNNFCHEEKLEAEQRGISVYEVCNERVASLPPGSTDVIFHPFLFGSNVQANARAGFYGLGAWHTRPTCSGLIRRRRVRPPGPRQPAKSSGRDHEHRAADRRWSAQPHLDADVCGYAAVANRGPGRLRDCRARRRARCGHRRRCLHKPRQCRRRKPCKSSAVTNLMQKHT